MLIATKAHARAMGEIVKIARAHDGSASCEVEQNDREIRVIFIIELPDLVIRTTLHVSHDFFEQAYAAEEMYLGMALKRVEWMKACAEDNQLRGTVRSFASV